MNRRLVLVLAALGAALGAAPARAAEVSTGRACYADPSTRKDTVTWSGSGFAPGGFFQAALDDAALDGGTGTADASGRASGSFAAPSLNAVIAPGTMQHRFTFAVFEGVSSATTRFTVSKLRAGFRPASGNPRTLKVRFEIYGFGLGGATAPPIFVHYVRPNGRVRTTVRVGTGRGDCGSLTSKRRRLFGFNPARGTWALQFDTSRAYVRGTPNAPFLFYRIPVRVG